MPRAVDQREEKKYKKVYMYTRRGGAYNLVG